MYDMKKKGKKMSEAEMMAKKNVLSSLRDQAAEAMGDKLKKVTVAAPSEEGLKKGLEKAKELVGALPMNGESEEEPKEGEHQMPDGSMMADSEMEDEHELKEELSLDEINAKLEELMQLKKQLEEQKA